MQMCKNAPRDHKTHTSSLQAICRMVCVCVMFFFAAAAASLLMSWLWSLVVVGSCSEIIFYNKFSYLYYLRREMMLYVRRKCTVYGRYILVFNARCDVVIGLALITLTVATFWLLLLLVLLWCMTAVYGYYIYALFLA